MADLDLTLRSVKGTPLTTAEVDQNWTDIETEVNADKDTSQNSNDKLLGTVAGTDTITATLTPTLTAYASGQTFILVPAAANTGATTLNIDSLGATNVFSRGAACVGGELASGVPTLVEYDGTQFNIIGAYNYCALTGTQTVAGNKTFSGTNIHSGGNTFNGDTTHNGNVTLTGKHSGISPPSGGTNIAPHTNLLIVAGTTPDEQVTVTADDLLITDTSGNQKLLSSVTLTNISNTSAGLLALDTGTVAADTWYYIWAIHIDSSDTTSGVYSTSNDLNTVLTNINATIGSGTYDMGGMVGAILTDATSDNLAIEQKGKRAVLDLPVQDEAALSLGTSANLSTLTAPPNVKATFGLYCTKTTASYVLCTEVSQTDTTPSVSNWTVVASSATEVTEKELTRRVDGSSQIRLRASATATSTYVHTNAWEWD